MIIVRDNGLDVIEEQLDGKQNYHGFPVPYEVVLSYNPVTRTISLTPIGTSFDIWVAGTKITHTGIQISPVHSNVTGTYFFSYNNLGQITVSNTVWAISDVLKIPVCMVYYNSTLQDGLALFELHSAYRNLAAHEQQHYSIGTFVAKSTHFSLSNYVLNGTTDSEVTFSVSSGTIYDEDINFPIAALPDAGPYTILRRTNLSEWVWTTDNTVPYLVNSGSNKIQRNPLIDQGGGNFSYQLQDVNTNGYVNYYLFASTMLVSNKRLFLIPSQNENLTATEATAQSVESLNLSELPISEYVPLWKITYRYQNSNSSTGKASLISITRLGGSRQSSLSFSGAVNAHNTLSGRSDLDSHPATSISIDSSGFNNVLTSTDNTVQKCVEKLDDLMLNNIVITTTNINKNLAALEFCTVISSGHTLTLPSNPTEGTKILVGVLNFSDTVISRNNKLIMGLNEDFTIDKPNVTVTFIYINSSIGWKIV